MSFEDIPELRQLLAKIPNDVLNSTQRLIILTHVTYENKNPEIGSHEKPAILASLVGLKMRAYMDNLHYLGIGKTWTKETGLREPCTNEKCVTHLKIIRTRTFARSGRAQTYGVNLEELRKLASMHLGAP